MPFKDFAPPRTAVGNSETNCQRHTQIFRRLFIHYIQLFATALWTNLEAVANGAMNILYPECCYSRRQLLFDIDNVTMSSSAILAMAQWTPPQYWQWSNDLLLRAIRNRAMMPVAMLRPVQIYWRLFEENGKAYSRSSFENADKTKMLPIPTVRWIFSLSLAVCFQIANSCARLRCNFEGLSQHGGWADFTKNFRLSLFNDDLSNKPYLGRIHLAGHYCGGTL